MNKVTKLLESLGDTSYDIFHKLEALNIKGFKINVCNCPISNFLKKNGCSYVEVFATRVNYTFKNGVKGAIQFINIDNGSQIADFICDFDYGKYPLIEF
jgi:hypothetical protein